MLIDYRAYLFGIGEAPTFPTGALPEPLAEFVAQVADAYDVDAAMPGAWALGVLSAACVGRLKTQPREGWTEHGPLWPCVVAEPGERKTPILRTLRKPLDDTEATIVADAMNGRDVAEATASAAHKASTTAEKDLATAMGDGDPDKIATAQARLTELVEKERELRLPPVPKLVGDDATSAKLHDLLAAHGGRFAVFSVEGDTLYRRLASGDGDFQGPYLAGHGGDTLRRALVGRHVADVDDPALTVVMAVQPEVLRARGSADDLVSTGFRDRFLFALPDSVLDIEPNPSVNAVDAFVAATYASTIREITETFWPLDVPRVLPYTDDAQKLFAQAETRHREMLTVRRDMEPTMGSAKKHMGTVSRIAGVLAVARDRDTEAVTLDDLHSALEIGDYFLTCARRLFGHTMTEWGDAQADLDAIVRYFARRMDKGETGGVTARLVQKSLSARAKSLKAAEFTQRLDVLDGNGWLIRSDSPHKTYRPHPELLASALKFGIVG